MAHAQDVVFVDGVRTPFGRAGEKGQYWQTRADDLIVKAMIGLLERNPNLPKDRVDDVAIAATTQTGDQGLTLGRTAAILAGLPLSVPGFAIDRMCAGAMTSVATTSAAVGSTMPAGAPRRPVGPATTGAGSSWGAQNTPIQMRIIVNNVSRLTTMLMATIGHWCAAKPETMSESLATNPDDGGTPARLSAGSRNKMPMSGALRTSPPTRLRRDDPPTCSINPPEQNSAVFTCLVHAKAAHRIHYAV